MDPLSAEIDEFHKEKQDPEYEEFVMKSIDSFSIHTPVKSVKVDLSYSQNTVPENLKKQFTKNGFLSSNGQFSHKDSLKNDQNFSNMNDFIDDKLNLVGDMVAHKKTLTEIKKKNKEQLISIHLDNRSM